jgi:hypothetical protein
MLPCREGRILGARIQEWPTNADGSPVDPNESRTIWRISLAENASPVRSVPLGKAPAGARVGIAFDGGFRPGYGYAAVLDIDSGTGRRRSVVRAK